MILNVDVKDYKNIFIDLADKLFGKDLINENDKIRLIDIINRDSQLVA